MQLENRNGINFTAGRWPLDPKLTTLIFLHGAGQSSAFWKAQVAGLRPQANTIALDLPGHGQSQGPGRNHLDGYMAAVSAFIKALGPQRLVLCGHSMGGAIVQEFMLQQPQEIVGGILVNTGAKLRVMPAIFEAIEKDYDGFLAMLPALALSKQSRLDTAVIERIDSWPKAAAAVTKGDFEACHAFDTMDRLADIDLPVLVIGGAEDTLTPIKFSHLLGEAIPQARLAVIANAGHFVPVEKPSEVNREIALFLQTLAHTAKKKD